VETSWNTEEERLITEATKAGLSRIEAIRHLRSSWFIGETQPPLSRPGRKMPKANPRYVEDARQDRLKAPARPDFRESGASTPSGKGSEPTVDRPSTNSVRKAASERQARWRTRLRERKAA
jgi:hypothetical protein